MPRPAPKSSKSKREAQNYKRQQKRERIEFGDNPPPKPKGGGNGRGKGGGGGGRAFDSQVIIVGQQGASAEFNPEEGIGLDVTSVISRSGKVNRLTTSFLRDRDGDVLARKADSTRPFKLGAKIKGANGFDGIPPAPILPELGFPLRPPWHRNESKGVIDERETRLFSEWLEWLHKHVSELLARSNAALDLDTSSASTSYSSMGHVHQLRARVQVGDVVSPFEHNLEVWRQLWRVLERSDVIVLCADIRCALVHIPRALYRHVTQTMGKPMIIALTKTDLVSQQHTDAWVSFLKKRFPLATPVPFSSKAHGTEGKGGVAARRKLISSKASHKDQEALTRSADRLLMECLRVFEAHKNRAQGDVTMDGDDEDPSTGPAWSSTKPKGLPTVGFVGHPNVGKSSVLNSLVKKHVVSVSRTCGHTKYLQTYLVRREPDSELVAKAHDLRRQSNISMSATGADADETDADLSKAADEYADEVAVEETREKLSASNVTIELSGQEAQRIQNTTNTNTHINAKESQQTSAQGVEVTDKDSDIVLELCDCPGLIFPVLGYTKRETVEQGKPDFVPTPFSPRALFECNGLYPIPQIREAFSAVRLLAESGVELTRVYNLTLDKDDYGEEWSPQGVVGSLADKKGYMVSGRGGGPDMHRAGLEIIRDTVDGFVLLTFSPPVLDESEEEPAGYTLFGPDVKPFDWNRK